MAFVASISRYSRSEIRLRAGFSFCRFDNAQDSAAALLGLYMASGGLFSNGRPQSHKSSGSYWRWNHGDRGTKVLQSGPCRRVLAQGNSL